VLLTLKSRKYATDKKEQNPVMQYIDAEVKSNPVLLFMKGTPDAPQCGFSRTVVNLLHHHDAKFKGINILEDDHLRQSVKDYSSWPTYPQLYVNGEFVGGHDIVVGYYKEGKLAEVLKTEKKQA
jgi:monothiol glutaredoxin